MNELIPRSPKPSTPSDILNQIEDVEYRNSLAWDSLQLFKIEIASLVPGSPEYNKQLEILFDSFFKLSIVMSELAIFKARNGIIGNSWYKE